MTSNAGTIALLFGVTVLVFLVQEDFCLAGSYADFLRSSNVAFHEIEFQNIENRGDFELEAEIQSIQKNSDEKPVESAKLDLIEEDSIKKISLKEDKEVSLTEENEVESDPIEKIIVKDEGVTVTEENEEVSVIPELEPERESAEKKSDKILIDSVKSDPIEKINVKENEEVYVIEENEEISATDHKKGTIV